jgi:reverse gyrase
MLQTVKLGRNGCRWLLRTTCQINQLSTAVTPPALAGQPNVLSDSILVSEASRHTLLCTSSSHLTDIQRNALPKIAGRHDVILHAPTGSGKTLAYLAPIMQNLKQQEDAHDIVARPGRPRAIVIVPTRELVHQVKVSTSRSKLRTHTCMKHLCSTLPNNLRTP